MSYPCVTLIGGAGFVGRHTVRRFADQGWLVRILTRDTIAAEFLKTAGYPGQITLRYADITRPETLAGALAGSDVVVNYVSILSESGRQTFAAINHAGAKAVAEEAARAGVQRLVQISALGAGLGHAAYAATKKAGEGAVREAFPEAVILRPSLIVGPEDGFFQRFARMHSFLPFLPLIAGGKTRFQPVLVGDVARAVYAAATDRICAGHSYEIAGDAVYSFRELLILLGSVTQRPMRFLPLSTSMAMLLGAVCEFLPFRPLITRDQVRMLAVDSVLSAGALTLRHLGIAPTPIEAELPQYLARFRG